MPPAMTRRPIHRFSVPLLMVIPVLIAANFAYLIAQSSTALEPLSQKCTTDNGVDPQPLQGILCTLTQFFVSSTAYPHGFAFMAVFLSFVAALVTITNIGALRFSSQSNFVSRNPLFVWLLTNAVSGAIVIPLLLFPSHMVRTREAFRAQANRSAAGDVGVDVDADADAYLIRRYHADFGTHRHHLPSLAALQAVSVGVGLGFVVPSFVLMFRPDTIVVLLWNIFPLFVWAIQRISYHLITVSEVVRLRRRGEMPSQEPASGVGLKGILVIAYGLPCLLSIISWGFFISVHFGNYHRPDKMTKVALEILQADFWSIIMVILYWFMIESKPVIVFWTIVSGLVCGPGGGLCLGWVMRKRDLCKENVACRSLGQTESQEN